ncbi:hypothetical protein ACFW04_006312 [Cataglyphis niger]
MMCFTKLIRILMQTFCWSFSFVAGTAIKNGIAFTLFLSDDDDDDNDDDNDDDIFWPIHQQIHRDNRHIHLNGTPFQTIICHQRFIHCRKCIKFPRVFQIL